MRHPHPERWAELARLPAAERVALEAHAAACDPCRAKRDRVLELGRTLAALGTAPPPPLNWDRLGARIHWSVSSELRRRQRARDPQVSPVRRYLPYVLGGAGVVAAAVAVALWLGHAGAPGETNRSTAQETGNDPINELPPLTKQHGPLPPVAEPGPNAPVPAPAALEGVVTLAQGGMTVDGVAAELDVALRAGSRLVTKEGRVAVQFGERSGFVVEPGSELAVVAFDEGAVELSIVTGAVTVEVTHRKPGQRFAVHLGAGAGGRRVEVRGTVFRVARSADTIDVTCTRGRVAVVDAGGELEVPAGARVALADVLAVTSGQPRVMDDSEAKRMAAAMRVVLLPRWSSAAEVRAGSAVLDVSAGRGVVRLDGVDVGTGAFKVRAEAGRHLVEANGGSRWIEADAGTLVAAQVARPIGRAHERAGQVKQQLTRYQGVIGSCGRDQRKQVGADWHAELIVSVEIGADGAVRAVSAVRGLREAEVEDCVLNVVRDRFTFPAGTPETIEVRVAL